MTSLPAELFDLRGRGFFPFHERTKATATINALAPPELPVNWIAQDREKNVGQSRLDGWLIIETHWVGKFAKKISNDF